METVLSLARKLANADGRSYPNSLDILAAEIRLASVASSQAFERAYAEGYASVSSMEPTERKGTGERKFRGKV